MLINKIKRSSSLYTWLRDKITPWYTKSFLIIFRVFPIRQNKIIVTSFFGKGYGDNGKYIVDELLKNKKGVKIFWGARKQYKNSIPSKVHYVKYFSPKYFYHLATAKIWMNNSRFVLGTMKRKNQFYIQLWHGDIAFKKIEADAKDALPKDYIKGAKNDSKMADLMISGSDFFTDLCRKSFWYNGQILECGCPRNDIFFNKKSCDDFYSKIRNYYILSKNTKILLYAPTFRKDYTTKYYDIAYISALKTLQKKFGGNWKILVRLHPNIAEKAANMKIWNSNIIDATKYPDAQELLIASDIVITDYSSVAFDFALLRRPVFLFAPDYNLYNKDRGFYLDYFNLPFPVAESTSQLQKNILNFSEKDYKVKLADFLNNQIGSKEKGEASKAIAQRIIKEVYGTKRR